MDFVSILSVSGSDSFYIPRSLSDRASMFDFSESFNSYFVSWNLQNKINVNFERLFYLLSLSVLSWIYNFTMKNNLHSWSILSQFNKGMVPLGSVCSEDDDVDENYVPMSAATSEPPVAPRSVRITTRKIKISFLKSASQIVICMMKLF